jgi:hypothetical protein
MALAVDYTGNTTLITSATAPSVHGHDVGPGVCAEENWRFGIIKSRVDLTLAGTLTSSDVYYALRIPQYTIVLRVWIQTITPETVAGPKTATFQIGDSSAASVFMNTTTAPSAAANGVISALAADTGAANVIAGKFYNAADYVLLTVGTHEFSLLVCDVFAFIVNCRARETS